MNLKDLNDKQEEANSLLSSGKTAKETAELVKLPQQLVSQWQNNNEDRVKDVEFKVKTVKDLVDIWEKNKLTIKTISPILKSQILASSSIITNLLASPEVLSNSALSASLNINAKTLRELSAVVDEISKQEDEIDFLGKQEPDY